MPPTARTESGGEYVERIPIEIPQDAPLGPLQIIIGDGPSVQASEARTGFTPKSLGQLVREINRTKALIVVEHDMQFIRMIAKQVTVFNQGSVLVEDTVENIMRNPQVRDIYLGKQAAA